MMKGSKKSEKESLVETPWNVLLSGSKKTPKDLANAEEHGDHKWGLYVRHGQRIELGYRDAKNWSITDLIITD